MEEPRGMWGTWAWQRQAAGCELHTVCHLGLHICAILWHACVLPPSLAGSPIPAHRVLGEVEHGIDVGACSQEGR